MSTISIGRVWFRIPSEVISIISIASEIYIQNQNHQKYTGFISFFERVYFQHKRFPKITLQNQAFQTSNFDGNPCGFLTVLHKLP